MADKSAIIRRYMVDFGRARGRQFHAGGIGLPTAPSPAPEKGKAENQRGTGL